MRASTGEEPSSFNFHFLDLYSRKESFHEEALQGLLMPQKRIPAKFLYDLRGSELFERICELPEYYVTRAETEILGANAGEITKRLGEKCLLLEFGSGASRKTRILLDQVSSPVAYVPIDISRRFLLESAATLAEKYPRLRIVSICADYTRPFSVPEPYREGARNRAAFFPGSTIGNFEPREAQRFLMTTAALLGEGGRFLVGVDLVKDPGVLHAAYNDGMGITAQFNLNLLHRMNRELGASFDVRGFAHRAFYNANEERVEMHLVSLRDQTVALANRELRFSEGETVHTENSYKYRPERFEEMAWRAGFAVSGWWTDSQSYFRVYLLEVRDAAGVAAA